MILGCRHRRVAEDDATGEQPILVGNPIIVVKSQGHRRCIRIDAPYHYRRDVDCLVFMKEWAARDVRPGMTKAPRRDHAVKFG